MRRIGHHNDNNISLFGNFLAAGAYSYSFVQQPLRGWIDAKGKESMAAIKQMPGHWCTHYPKPEKSNITHYADLTIVVYIYRG